MTGDPTAQTLNASVITAAKNRLPFVTFRSTKQGKALSRTPTSEVYSPRAWRSSTLFADNPDHGGADGCVVRRDATVFRSACRCLAWRPPNEVFAVTPQLRGARQSNWCPRRPAMLHGVFIARDSRGRPIYSVRPAVGQGTWTLRTSGRHRSRRAPVATANSSNREPSRTGMRRTTTRNPTETQTPLGPARTSRIWKVS